MSKSRNQRRRKDQQAEAGRWTKVLCMDCSQFFTTPKQCLECSNWNICLPCLKIRSDETLAILRSRGITCMG